MKGRRLASLRSILVGAAVLVAGHAVAQPSQPGVATPSQPHGERQPSVLAPPPSASGSLGAASAPSGSASAPAGGVLAPSPPASALPPGHPPTGAMPPGHPPADAVPPGHPPTGSTPPGGRPSMGSARPRAPGGMYEPPEDEVVEEESWPPGTIEVHVRDADDRPVEGAPVVLDVVQGNVSVGEQREKLQSATDVNGVARFEGMKVGMSATYAASSVRVPSRFEAPAFNLPEKGGMRVVLHVYDTVTDVEEAQIGVRALAFFSLREDAIQTEQILEVFNLGRTAWQAEVPVELPADFKAFNRAEEGGVANVDPTDTGYVLRGTFRPGRTAVGFRWQVPLENEPAQTIRVGMPPRVAQARVIAEASKAMELVVEGAPASRRTRNRDGRSVLVTERSSPPGEKGLKALTVTLRGLPTRGPGRWIAAALAAAMIAAAILAARRGSGTRSLAEDAREDLIEAREALLDELVALERARTRGAIGPKTYERVRAAMLDALANVVAELEGDASHLEPVAIPPIGSAARGAGGGAPADGASAETATPRRRRRRRDRADAARDRGEPAPDGTADPPPPRIDETP